MRHLYYLVLILSLTAELYPQEGWFHQSPIPNIGGPNDVFFTDGSGL